MTLFDELGTLLAAFTTFFMLIGGFVAIVYIITIVGWWKVFKKAGVAGWKSLIPIYNQYLAYKISGLNGWLILLPMVSGFFTGLGGGTLEADSVNLSNLNACAWIGIVLACVYFIVQIVYRVKLARAFKMGRIFQVFTVFFPYLAMLYLGFSSVKYDKKAMKK